MSISEILGTIEEGDLQVCATATADYDHDAGKVSVALDAFTRRASAANDGAQLPQTWLPESEHVSEHLSRMEADDFVKDVFHSWVKRVRASVPAGATLRP